MLHPRLKGSHFDMGFQYGRNLHGHGFRFPDIGDKRLEYGLACYDELMRFYPDIADEIKGFAEGCKANEDAVAAFLLCLVVFDTAPQCTIFAYRNMRDTIFGRNYDMSLSMKNVTESPLVCPANGYAFLGHSDCFIGKADGVNEKGLAVGYTFVNGPGSATGVNFYFIVRYILEKCSTVDEAIRAFDRMKLSHSGNYLLADRSGYMAVMETAPGCSAVRLPEEDERFIVCTNGFRMPSMIPLDAGLQWSHSDARYMSVDSCLRLMPGLDVDATRRILSDKENHVRLNLKKEGFGTLWSVITGLTTLDAYRAEGLPGKAAYKKDTRLSSWIRTRKISRR